MTSHLLVLLRCNELFPHTAVRLRKLVLERHLALYLYQCQKSGIVLCYLVTFEITLRWTEVHIVRAVLRIIHKHHVSIARRPRLVARRRPLLSLTPLLQDLGRQPLVRLQYHPVIGHHRSFAHDHIATSLLLVSFRDFGWRLLLLLLCIWLSCITTFLFRGHEPINSSRERNTNFRQV